MYIRRRFARRAATGVPASRADNAARTGTPTAVKPALRIAISILLTVSFIWLFARRFDVRAATAALRAASPGLIAASVLVTLLAYLIRAWRWRVLMAPVKQRVGMYNLTSTMFIGFMISFIVPFRIGEVARPVLLARREKVSTTATLATVALERLFDVMTVMALLLVFVLTSRGAALMASHGDGSAAGQASVYLRRAVVATGVLVAVALPLVIVLVLFPKQVTRLLHRLHGKRHGAAARLTGTVEKLIDGLGVMRHKRHLAESIALSFAMWLVIDASVLLGLRAFDLPLRFTDMFLLIVPLGAGIVMPTPGGVGPYEYFCQVSLTGFWGVAQASAGAAAITLHAVTLLPTIVLGLFFMWQGGVRPAEVRKMAHISSS
ncbi:MAG: hypothetical protein DMF51_00180 [Acidobacteria bacterium]|nr:MAG: hypothetical protein DMF51_00180 [Acidobacteriota bacterium]